MGNTGTPLPRVVSKGEELPRWERHIVDVPP